MRHQELLGGRLEVLATVFVRGRPAAPGRGRRDVEGIRDDGVLARGEGKTHGIAASRGKNDILDLSLVFFAKLIMENY
jgi:hypothetical protein